MKVATLTGIFLILVQFLSSQQADSAMLAGSQVIEMQLEHLQELSDAGIDLSELSEELIDLLYEPININIARKSDLKKLHLLNDMQIRNLLDYRNKYGEFISVYEIKHVDGIGSNTLKKIVPFITVKPSRQASKSKRSLFHGQHELLFRYQRKLVTPSGHRNVADSIRIASPGSYYLGDPSRIYIRYRYKVRGKLSAGILAEKDPGEELFTKTYGPDLLSFHLAYEGEGLIRHAIVGDFHARFGQGLVLWSGMSFQGGSDPASIKRYTPGISPNTSANENTFLRGAGISLAWKKLEIKVIYSKKNVDANLVFSTDGHPIHVSSLQTSGYHRTLNEIADRNSLEKSIAAANLSVSGRWFRTGITTSYLKYDLEIRKENKPEYIYSFNGKENLVTGIDFDVIFRRTNIFGELARSMNGGWAFMSGITHLTENGSIFALSFHEYRKDFQNLDARASGRRDHNANERAVRLMMEFPFSPGLSMQASMDHYTYPWLIYGSTNAQQGQDCRIRLVYSSKMRQEFSLRYRFRNQTVNIDPEHGWFDIQASEQKHEIQATARSYLSEYFSGKLQTSYVWRTNRRIGYRSKGSLLLMDVYCHPPWKNMKFTFRYALFNTDDYNSRLYAYEHDVLYASSMPAYYGKGFRVYFLARYSPLRWLDTWLRFSLTTYTDRKIISSGADEINGNKLPEIKFQLRLKL